jgi:hypothetical protein
MWVDIGIGMLSIFVFVLGADAGRLFIRQAGRSIIWTDCFGSLSRSAVFVLRQLDVLAWVALLQQQICRGHTA